MTAVMTDATAVRDIADKFVAFLESGVPAAGLFAKDVFADVTLPTWRLQGRGIADLVAIRKAGHPARGRVPRHRLDLTPTGFVLEFEEEWQDDEGERWYSREIARADVTAEGITHVAVYCTGDWSESRVAEHAAAVTLLVP